MAIAAITAVKTLIHEYAKLRKLASDRNRYLKKAGFEGYNAPKIRDLTTDQIKSEKKKLEKWLGSERGTVKGSRKIEEEKLKREEARKERKRQYDRERYQKWRQENPPKERPPRFTDEERRQRHNQQNREYRQRRKAKIEAQRQEDRLQAWINQQDRPQSWKNFLSGLRKWGINVTTPEELKAWMDYNQERKHDADKNKYFFGKWLQEAEEIILNERDENAEVTDPEVIYNLIEDFENWKAENKSMVKEFNAWLKESEEDRDRTKYSSEDLMSVYFGSENFRKEFKTKRSVKE